MLQLWSPSNKNLIGKTNILIITYFLQLHFKGKITLFYIHKTIFLKKKSLNHMLSNSYETNLPFLPQVI